MYEVMIILTLMSPDVQPMEQEIPVPHCEVVKARIEAVWGAASAPGFYGAITCEEREKKVKK